MLFLFSFFGVNCLFDIVLVNSTLVHNSELELSYLKLGKMDRQLKILILTW